MEQRKFLIVCCVTTLLLAVIKEAYSSSQLEPNSPQNRHKPMSHRNAAAATLQQLLQRAGGAVARRKGRIMSPPESSNDDHIDKLSTALHQKLVTKGRPSGASSDRTEGRSSKSKRYRKNRRKIASRTDWGFGGGNQYTIENNIDYSLPECATQQVCNAVYLRLNLTLPLCSCPSFTGACSASYARDDQHSIELRMSKAKSQAVTMIKTCEPVWSVRDCNTPRDWSILALQNTRTAKSHYLVICKCPGGFQLDGPLNHEQPEDAKIASIRVFGMMCVDPRSARRTLRRTKRELEMDPPFPMEQLRSVLSNADIIKSLL